MKTYSHYGFKRFIVCLGYKGDIIKEYFLNYRIRNADFTINLSDEKSILLHNSHENEDWEVTLAETGSRALTGARIKKIENYINSEIFCLTYGDGVSDLSIDKTVDFHLSHKKIATVTGVKPPSRFGELIVSGNKVIEFGEKPQVGSGMINGGFFVFSKGIFDYLSDDDNCSLEKEPLENLAREGNLMVYQHNGFWQCMDTPRDMTLLNELWDNRTAPWKIWE